MARASTRSLTLQIGVDTGNLSAGAKAAKSVIAQFGTESIDIVEAVNKAFTDLGGGSAEASARQLEASYKRTFDSIRAGARALADAPTPQAALQVLDIENVRQAIAALERQAATERAVGEAAAKASFATAELTRQGRALAVNSLAAARATDEEANALRAQLTVLEGVEAQIRATTAAEAGAVPIRRNAVTSQAQQRQGMIQLGQQFNDFSTQVLAGTSPVQAFTQQAGQATFALSQFGGKLGAAGVFLSGFAGTGLIIAISVLGKFVEEQLKANNALDEAVDKLKKEAEQAEISARAKEQFGNTIEGVTAAIHEQRKALDLEIKAEEASTQATYDATKQKLGEEIQYRKTTQAILEQAQALAEAARQRANDPSLAGEGGFNGGAVAEADASRRVAELQAKLDNNAKAIDESKKNLRDLGIKLATEEAKLIADPVEQIKKKYDDQVKAARAAARATSEITLAEQRQLAQKLAAIEKQKTAAIAAEQKRQSDSRPTSTANRQFGREIDVAQATAIVAGIGGRVTSGNRSTALQERLYQDKLAGRHDGPVAKPGTSAHERGGAIDVAYGPGITVKAIKDAFAAAGVSLRKVLDEPGQRVFHVEFGKAGRAGPSAEQAAQKARNNEAEFGNLLTRAQEQQLRLLDRQNADIATSADQAAESVEIERANLNAAAEKGVADGKWTQAQADGLKTLNDQNALLKTDLIRRQAIHDLLREEVQAANDNAQLASETLGLDLRLANTRKERLAIELKLLAIEQERVRREAAAIVADPTSSTKDKIAAERRIAQSQDNAGKQRQEVQNRYLDPVSAYKAELEDRVGDTNEALANIKVDALRGLEDSFVGIITGTENVASAFKKLASSIIADIARIVVQKLILKAIGGIFGFADGAVDVSASTVPGYSTGTVPGFADGIIRGPGTGKSDSIFALMEGVGLIRVANGESIINAEATKRHRPLLKAINDNTFPGFASGIVPDGVAWRTLPAPQAVARGGNDTAPIAITLMVTKGTTFEADVIAVSGPQTVQILQASAPQIVETATNNTVAQLRRRRI